MFIKPSQEAIAGPRKMLISEICSAMLKKNHEKLGNCSNHDCKAIIISVKMFQAMLIHFN